ncbi:hypothetical protein TNCV_2592401 [Trichonephila clavipes]|nr:hypothetical protein TNCV_2592401 [Trichonephila clavipes]
MTNAILYVRGKFPHGHYLEGAGNKATSEFTKKREFNEWTRDAEVDDPGLKKERPERWPSRDAPPVVHERDATATAGSDVVQSGRPIFDDFFQHLWSYIGNNTANVVFQMVKRLWLIRIDQ